MNVKTAIEAGDLQALTQLLANDASLANLVIEWGKKNENRAHPLHYVADMVFGGVLKNGTHMAVLDALLSAGSNANHRAPNGETPLIGAASLGTEDIALRLIEAGARPHLLGGFQETALHWAAHVGMPKLADHLLKLGVDANQKDERFNSTPLGWAIYGWFRRPSGKPSKHVEVVTLLVAAGASVEPEWLAEDRLRADREMFKALSK
jgi:ankyrin repeat protein